MTTIADLSKYDGPRPSLTGYDGILVNCQDPDMGGKVEDALALGIGWGSYGWVYSGDGGGSMQRLSDNVGALGHGAPPLGYWLDYEEAGVSQPDLVNALDRSESLGTFDRTGIYTYLYIIGSIANILRGRPLWLAYYPGANDGTYPEGQDGPAVNWGAILWQYTSSNGARDLSRVVNEAAWGQWAQGTAPVIEKKVVDGMWIVEKRDGGQPDQYWEPVAGGLMQLTAAEAFGRLAAGIPHQEYPTLGLLGYGLRSRQVFQAAIPAGAGSGPTHLVGTTDLRAA